MNSMVTFTFLTSTIFALENPFENKIVNGRKALKGQFPYQAEIQTLTPEGFRHHCGGCVLTPKHILTAAHCFDNTTTYRVRVGLLNLNDGFDIGQTVAVKEVFVHPEYPYEAVSPNDIAILKLGKELVYSEFIQPVNLPRNNSIPTGFAVLSGWGRIDSGNEMYSNRLRFAELNIIGLNACKKSFIDTVGTYGPLNENNICTRNEETFPCQGDSGGPLVQNNTIIGIPSFTTFVCDTRDSATAYTSISKYVDWINKQIIL